MKSTNSYCILSKFDVILLHQLFTARRLCQQTKKCTFQVLERISQSYLAIWQVCEDRKILLDF